MRVLYVTRLDVPIAKEHVFIKTVWDNLRRFDEVECLEVLRSADGKRALDFDPQTKVWTATVPPTALSGEAQQTAMFTELFGCIKPTLVHSNMHEGTEIVAAKALGIAVVTTIHIGSIICPRGGNGLWTPDDRICDGLIGDKCITCCCHDLPLPRVSNLLVRHLPEVCKSKLHAFFATHQTFYFSRLFSIDQSLENRKNYLEVLKYAHPIAANRQLYEVLQHYGCHPILLPHGVKPRKRLDYPPTDGKIKFYYLGRVNHQKGIHVVLDAFKGIERSLYEFHIVGEGNHGRRNQRYFRQIVSRLNEINAFYHGSIDNDDLEQYIKDWHVMIHPAICHEVYGITISESMALGRPVLATKCCGSEMQIQDGGDGWLISTNDVVALRAKILEIIEHRDELPTMSQRCRLPMPMPDYTQQLYVLYNKITGDEREIYRH